MGFEAFKKAQAKQDESQLVEEQKGEAKSYKDDRFWMFTKDSSGNAKAIIRFLPQQDPTKPAYIKTFKHAFQNEKTGKWLIDECPWTIKVKCPICLYAHETYEQYKDKPSKFRPGKQTWFISNILIVKDELNPENEGKVFLYRFGRDMFKKIEDAIKGDEDDDISPIKVFNFFEGHNFRINVSEKSIPGYSKPVNDYDKCRFELQPSEVCDGDEEAQKTVYECIYDLDEFLNPELFKSEEQLKAKLANMISGKKSIIDELKEQESLKEKESSKVKEKESPNVTSNVTEKDEDDDIDDFFDSLDEDDDIPY